MKQSDREQLILSATTGTLDEKDPKIIYGYSLGLQILLLVLLFSTSILTVKLVLLLEILFTGYRLWKEL
jgi:hypothetical protein